MLAARQDGLDGKALLALVDQLKNKLGSAVILLGGVQDDKVVLVAGVTQDLTSRLKAGDLMRQAAAAVGGSGRWSPRYGPGRRYRCRQAGRGVGLGPAVCSAGTLIKLPEAPPASAGCLFNECPLRALGG